MGSTILK